jgi:hypothetical protein
VRRLLNVTEWHTGIQRRRDERVSERVRADLLDDPGPWRDPADDPPGAMAVQPPPISGQEDRPISAVTDRQVDRAGGTWRQRDGDDLAALPGDG